MTRALAQLEAPRPRFLPTAAAARYCSISRWGLLRARDRGELQPSGRRGRTLTWALDELDRWMAGQPLASETSDVRDIAPRPATATTGALAANCNRALARARDLARGVR